MATVVTNVGKGLITSALTSSNYKYIGWGTGATAADVSQTTLSSEQLESGNRVAGTQTQQTTSTTNDTYQVVGTLTAGGVRAITNAGIFDASTSGNMFLMGNFSTVNLSAQDSIAFTIKTQFS